MSYEKLIVYKKAFEVAMKIFETTKGFPKEETYSLTDQVRRSSRSVCTSIAEAYRKRLYPKHFVSKISDADSENSETRVWIEFALASNYIDNQQAQHLQAENEEIGRLLNHMISNPEKYV